LVVEPDDFVFTKTNPLLVVVTAGVIGYFGIV
jgi:hypothetical protein